MTKQERIIVSAYTGVLMCNFGQLHEYIEEKLNRPVFTHEMASPLFQEVLRKATRADFLVLCNTDEE